MNQIYSWGLLIALIYAITQALWIEFRRRQDQKVIWNPWDVLLEKMRKADVEDLLRHSEEIEIIRDKLHARQRDTWSANPFRWLVCLYQERRNRC